jgi:1-acyl-sn-glycerol-3-phosphate acyltransferase
MNPSETVRLPESKKWLVDGFCWYTRRMVSRQFHSFGVQDELLQAVEIDAQTPLVAYANHASWWDPIAAMLLQRNYFANRTFYAPIDADALEKYRIMAKLGFYGVRIESFDGASAFLKMTKSILNTKRVTIWITPEGKFSDVRDYSLPLMPGLAHLASKMQGILFLPVAFEYGFWNENRPQIFVRFGSPIDSNDARSKADWNELLTSRLRQTQSELAQSVQQREPAAFRYLIASRPVRLGWYDYCRSWAARFRGRPFDPRHSV